MQRVFCCPVVVNDQTSKSLEKVEMSSCLKCSFIQLKNMYVVELAWAYLGSLSRLCLSPKELFPDTLPKK